MNTRSTDSVELTPREIVDQLDRYIVGQAEAKRAIAVAVRNRWRRSKLSDEMQTEISPKNILMAGPTGVGKTELARRLAKLTNAPFVKVEATKYTEVGYYGRDVESMVRDLVENAITMVAARERENVKEAAEAKAEDRLLDLLLPTSETDNPTGMMQGLLESMGQHTQADAPVEVEAVDEAKEQAEKEAAERRQRTREKMRVMLREGILDEKPVDISVTTRSAPMMVGGVGMENMDIDIQGMFEKLVPKNTKRRTVPVSQARQIFIDEESEKLIDDDKIASTAIDACENNGIIFVDEIDKVIATEGKSADVSRQGVQRDLLPIVEGTSVQTKHGYIKTDHILFIAAGAFHKGTPSELMPELQGRFPIRVELSELTQADFVRILTEPTNSLIAQYKALLGVEGVDVEFTSDAIERLAQFGFETNQSTQNIGARRLYTILEKLLDELNFEASDMGTSKVTINAAYVSERLQAVCEDEDLSRFIL